MNKTFSSNVPDVMEQWCIENCKKGCVYKTILGMVDKYGQQCARITCKEFCEHKWK